MKVSEVMTTEYEIIDKDQMLSSALHLMKKKDQTRLIVMQNDKVIGLLSFRDVADRLGSPKTEGKSSKSLHISSAMTFPVFSIDPNEDVKTAAQTMLDKRISSLLVMENEVVKGLLRKYDLLKVYSKCKNLKVRDLMTESPIQITGSERVISARNTMMEKKFSLLPVVDEGELVGIVDDETLAEALAMFRDQVHVKHQKSRIQEFYVGQIMKKNPPTIKEKEPLCNAVEILLETRLKGILVIDDSEKLIGIITLTDITRSIAEGK
ncbi:MAG: CBS domain-containing protein [Asgard group archaeon]|nr:CBS domain-containing protein [Asgard group archaeon]